MYACSPSPILFQHLQIIVAVICPTLWHIPNDVPKAPMSQENSRLGGKLEQSELNIWWPRTLTMVQCWPNLFAWCAGRSEGCVVRYRNQEQLDSIACWGAQWTTRPPSDPQRHPSGRRWSDRGPRCYWITGNVRLWEYYFIFHWHSNSRNNQSESSTISFARSLYAHIRINWFCSVQLDIEVVFDYPNVTKVVHEDATHDDSYHFDCSQGGAAHRGLFGPFGLLVLADERQKEQTAIFFYVSYSRSKDQWTTRFCSDQTR